MIAGLQFAENPFRREQGRFQTRSRAIDEPHARGVVDDEYRGGVRPAPEETEMLQDRLRKAERQQKQNAHAKQEQHQILDAPPVAGFLFTDPDETKCRERNLFQLSLVNQVEQQGDPRGQSCKQKTEGEKGHECRRESFWKWNNMEEWDSFSLYTFGRPKTFP